MLNNQSNSNKKNNQVNKFLTFFGIEKKDNYHIDAGDKQQLLKVFEDFIQLRKRVKAEMPKLQTI